ncbi:MAG: 3-hydroxyacyl-[acyl-carrier-protein] dehydratase FabZ [Candidatus Omnitrophica bacterium]|nr:3-hydroxyacyl-[acyl-carrier-protein] dehydratase FabZ [Candidatus Omnitrophota bacterium]
MTTLSIDKVLWIRPGEGIAACGRIPEESEFFKDHFPDFPVLPGVLALEMLKQTAERYLESLESEKGRHFFLKQIRATRFSKYLRPGDEWESRLVLVQSAGEDTVWDAKLLFRGEVAVSAKLTLARVKDPRTSTASA